MKRPVSAALRVSLSRNTVSRAVSSAAGSHAPGEPAQPRHRTTQRQVSGPCTRRPARLAARRRSRIAAGAIIVSAALLLTACGSSQSSPSSGSSGGAVTMALQAGEPINYIFPFMSSQYVNATNIDTFQYLMYRPLYWWDGSPYVLSRTRSLAAPPQFKDGNRVAVLHINSGWHFSNGETIGPKNVAFFLNMLVAERTNFWFYFPGAFPDTLSHVTYNNRANTVSIHLKQPTNPTWFLQSQLTMITPFPTAWDLTGPGKKGDCASENAAVAAKSCPAVYKYLTHEATNTRTYDSNPLWKIVDGPFRLSSFGGGTSVVLVPNKRYSGSPKPSISKLTMSIATSDAAEYTQLRSHALTIGYIPYASAPIKPADAATPSTNPVPGYTFEPATATWSWNSLFENYNNPQIGPLVHQLYFRQALQSLIDQQSDISAALRGYGYQDVGVNPPLPANPYETAYEKSHPYPFSLAKAKQYLTSHGWSVPANGIATCTHAGTGPSDCGQGIAQGSKMPAMKLQYSTGDSSYTLEMANLQSDASKVGIKITPVATPESGLARFFSGCTPSQSTCSWQLMYLGSPETDDPNFYPESSVVFKTHAIFNVSNYSNPHVDQLFRQIFSKPGNAALDSLDNYLVRTAALPWMPVPDEKLYVVSSSLSGYSPSPITVIEPENWSMK